MNHEPNFFENVRAELSDLRTWVDRCIVLGYAVLAGLCVVAFTVAADWAFAHFRTLEHSYPWAILVWTPAVTASIVWATRRWFPGATGSGIPQIKAAIDPELPADRWGWFASLKLSAGNSPIKIRVYATGQNLFTITKYTGLDPEIGVPQGTDVNNTSNTTYRNVTGSGVDVGTYPSSRYYTLGLNVTF